MRWIADLAYLLAGLIYTPSLLYQMIFQNKNRRGWRQRFGFVPRRAGHRPCIWIHAVSVGEINATTALVRQLLSLLPDYDVVISTTTDTGHARAGRLYPDLLIFRYPLDFSPVVARVLRRIRPTLIVLMELEVWYNLLTMAARRGVRVCIANGRFTQRSASRFRLIAPLARRMFSQLAWVGAQTDEIAQRFRDAGVPQDRVEVVGSMKWDTAAIATQVDGARQLADALGIKPDPPLIVLGSSGPGEEELFIEACDCLPLELREVRLAIVPRKPERFDEVARLIEKRGRPCLRRSELPDGSLPPTNTSGRAVLLGDTMGELRKFYSLAGVVVIGRSFVPLGGSDPMEVAALGKPILAGPHLHNFAEPARILQEAGALRIASTAAELTAGLAALLADEKMRDTLSQTARRTVKENQGATARTVARLPALLSR